MEKLKNILLNMITIGIKYLNLILCGIIIWFFFVTILIILSAIVFLTLPLVFVGLVLKEIYNGD